MTAALPTHHIFIVQLPKQVEIANIPAITSELDRKIQSGRKVILDFSQTCFIQSEAISLLLDGIAKAQQRSARLSLRGVRPSIKVRLEAGGILDYFRRNSHH